MPGGSVAAPLPELPVQAPSRRAARGSSLGAGKNPPGPPDGHARRRECRASVLQTRDTHFARSNSGRWPNNAKQRRSGSRRAAPRRSQPSGPPPAAAAAARSRPGRRRPSPRPLISWRRPVRLRSSAIARSISCKERSGSPLASPSRDAARPPLPAEAMLLPPPAMISCQAAPAARTALPGGGGGRSRGPLCDSDKSAEPSRSSPLAQPDVPRALPYSAQPPTEAVAGTALPGTARPGPAPPLPASAIASTAPPPPHQPMVRRRTGRRAGCMSGPRLLCRRCWQVQLSSARLRSRTRSRAVSLPPEYPKERLRVPPAPSIRCCSC